MKNPHLKFTRDTDVALVYGRATKDAEGKPVLDLILAANDESGPILLETKTLDGLKEAVDHATLVYTDVKSILTTRYPQ